MTLKDVLSRYDGYGILVYGGEKTFVDTLPNVIGWYVNGMNMVEERPIPDKLIQLVITTNGYLDGVAVELRAVNDLKLVNAIIYHGYPEFKTEGIPVMKELYTGGCVIVERSGEVYRLSKVGALIPSPTIATPFKYSPFMDKLLPYVHIYTRLEGIVQGGKPLKIPLKETIPRTTTENSDIVTLTSSFYDKNRKLLVAAIEMAISSNTKNFLLLYYGDLYITWLPQFLTLFSYLNPTIHLWGKDTNVQMPTSSHVHIRPPAFGVNGTDRPSIDAYKREYGPDNNILILADDDGEHLLSINPRYAYFPYTPSLEKRGDTVILPWTSPGNANIRYARGKEREWSMSQSNINHFHLYERMDSYNIGGIISQNLKVSGIGRSLTIPSLGLCTCYDCAYEVDVMTRYMSTRKIPWSEETIKGLLTSNGPSLWPISRPSSKPSSRTTLTLHDSDISTLLTLDIYAYGDIAINTTPTKPTPYIEGSMPRMERLTRLVKGERWPLVVNFHKDFVKNYDPTRDKGHTGSKYYNDFLQAVAINKSSLDVVGLLTAFILAKSPSL